MSDENALEAMSLLTHEQRQIQIVHPAEQIQVEVDHADVVMPPTDELSEARVAAFEESDTDDETLSDEEALAGIFMSMKGLEACYLSIKPNKRAEDEEDERDREFARKHKQENAEDE